MIFPYFRRARARVSVILILTLGFITAVGPIATDLYLPGFPAMGEDLSASDSVIRQTLTAYMVGMAVGQLFLGPLSDRFGRWRPLVVATAVGVGAGVVAAVTGNVEVLIAMRFVQGLAGSAGAVISRAIVRDLVTGVQAAKLFSVLMMITGVAPIVAPVLGGFLLEHVGWRGLMLVLAIAAAIALAGILLFVPETLAADRRERHVSAAFRNIAILVRNRTFLGFTLVLVFSFGMLFAFISASSFVMQDVFGLTPSQYSIVFAVNALAMLIASTVNTRIVGRVRPAVIVRLALSLQFLATATLLITTVTGVLSQPLLQVLVFLSTLTVAPIAANSTALALSSVEEGVGMASAIMGALQFGAGGLVSVLVGLGSETSTLPMAVVMASCTVGAVVSFLLARRSAR